jgi:penicillin-binding protein 1A
MFRRGDLAQVRLLDVPADGDLPVELEQLPKVEAALVALDPRTGEVLALVGGFNFGRSEFDRAVQARRQAGSSFKPIVAATALNEGATPSTRLLDAPTVFVDTTTMQPYQPENYGKKYYGEITLREALEKSANIATVRLLDRTGYTPVIETARRLGITTDLRPYPSMALGAFEVSLMELTGAYAAFANEGVRIAPQLVQEVTDRDRTPLFRARPEVEQAVSPQVAYQMNRLLQGVITDGTGAAAASLGRPLAGKTGTTDDFTDAWFVGYAPDLAVGVWVGFDTKTSLGSRETGAQAALPIWQSFMEQVLAGRPIVDFAEPPSIVPVAVDRLTGLRANEAAGCVAVIPEAFVEGTEPAIACSSAEHERLRFPWPFQAYPLGEDGALEIPVGDLERLLAAESFVRLSADGDSLEFADAAGRATLAVRTLPGASPPIPEEVTSKVDTTTWVGADGRRPEVVIVGTSPGFAKPGSR